MRLPKPNNIITEKYVVGMSVFKNRLAKIKLSANESALGPSPKAKKEYIKVSDRKSTRLNSSHSQQSRMPSSA